MVRAGETLIGTLRPSFLASDLLPQRGLHVLRDEGHVLTDACAVTMDAVPRKRSVVPGDHRDDAHDYSSRGRGEVVRPVF